MAESAADGSDSLAVAFYPFIFVAAIAIAGSHSGWLRRRDERDGGLFTTYFCCIDVEFMGEAKLVRMHCYFNLFCGLLLAAANIIVYRVVLIEHLRGTVSENRGFAAVITTLLIVVAIATVLVSHIYLLGIGVLSAPRARTHAACNVLAMALILAIVVAKLSMGIDFYDEDCGADASACGAGTQWNASASLCLGANATG